MITLRIEDMTCGGCAGRIARAIAGLDPNARVEADVASRLLRVATTIPEAELVQEIRDAGYTAVAVTSAPSAAPRAGGCCCSARRAAALDADQAKPLAGGTCCG